MLPGCRGAGSACLTGRDLPPRAAAMIKLVAIARKMLLRRGGRGGGWREMAEELSKTCGRFRRGSTVALPAVGGREE